MVKSILKKKPIVLIILLACLLIYLVQWSKVPSQLSHIVERLAETLQSDDYQAMFSDGYIERSEIVSSVEVLYLFLSPIVQLPCEYMLCFLIIGLISIIVWIIINIISHRKSLSHIRLSTVFKYAFFSLYVDAVYYLIASVYAIMLGHDISIDTVAYLTLFFARLICKVLFVILAIKDHRLKKLRNVLYNEKECY